MIARDLDPFMRWLRSQKDRDDPVGDLTRDTFDRSSTPKTRQELRSDMRRLGAVPAGMECTRGSSGGIR